MNLAPDDASHTCPPLYHKGRKGEMRVWQVWAKDQFVYTSYGTIDGKKQTSKVRAQPTNVGKKHETTAEQQAINEALYKHKHKLERKYSLTVEDAQAPLSQPMKAQPFYRQDKEGEYHLTSKAKKFMEANSSGFDVQPKLDGVRATAQWEEGKVTLRSNSGKLFPFLEHVTDPIQNILPRGCVFDGELYIHGMLLEEINALVPKHNSKNPKDDRVKLEYWIFDMPVIPVHGDEAPWSERAEYLYLIYGEKFRRHEPLIRLVPSKTVNDLQELKAAETRVVARGYEGAMVRSRTGFYEWGYRSNELLKLKQFEDEEFMVIDAKPGKGKHEKAVVFVCKNDVNDEEFDVVPRGNQQIREGYLSNKDDYIGRKLTVRFQQRTKDLKPFLPVGITFREDV